MAEEKKVSKDRGKWFREMRSELKKVVWPDGKTTAKNTGTVLLEALVSGLPVLVTDVCGYAHYIADADCGRVLPGPFEQNHLNRTLADMLADPERRAFWSRNGLLYADSADLYSMPQKAADVILASRCA